MENAKIRITSFRDLFVYQSSYGLMLSVIFKVLPRLPVCERNDLQNQLRRSCKAIPRLIAEGYAKRQQRAGFNKYLEDAMAETNETIVGLTQCADIYAIRGAFMNEVIDGYDKVVRQLYKLNLSWRTFKRREPRNDVNETCIDTLIK
ncbi:four helix bundle protein [Candidatus Falkowbacteria bacterium]|nr:four helix bundle protein [Candidatus Falkowbacteria bacterium]